MHYAIRLETSAKCFKTFVNCLTAIDEPMSFSKTNEGNYRVRRKGERLFTSFSKFESILNWRIPLETVNTSRAEVEMHDWWKASSTTVTFTAISYQY